MTIEEFLKQFNYAPYDDKELAEIASEVDGEVGEAAQNFLNASDAFNMVLDKIGYERG